MNNVAASLVGLCLLVAPHSTVSAEPVAVMQSSTQSSHLTTRGGPVSHEDLLNVNGIRLGMDKDDIKALHLTRETWPLDMKYGHTGRVTFVAATELRQGTQYVATGYDPVEFIHTWGTPWAEGKVGDWTVIAYPTGTTVVVMRYQPARLDARRGQGGEVAIATDLAWVPYDWGHALLERARQ